MTGSLPEHSPVGASAIKRVLACPASVGLAEGIPDDESDHAALGTAVHAIIEQCFNDGDDAWKWIGGRMHGIPVDKTMADGAQVMLDAVRLAHPDRNQGNFFVERKFHCPTIHPLFFGTSDCVYIEQIETSPGVFVLILHVWDYKNGVTLVEADAEQLKYYACGALETLIMWEKVDKVVLHLVQPNGFHSDGVVRDAETTPEELVLWLEDVCIPGMELAISKGKKAVVSGSHCKFCPVRTHACPALMYDVEEFNKMIDILADKGADALDDSFVARLLDLGDKAGIAIAAAKKTGFARMMAGQKIPGWALMHGKAHRQMKDGAAVAARAKFGDQGFTVPELKSPAQIELLPEGKAFTALWAWKPDGGLRIARESEAGPKVSVDTKSLFKPVLVASRAGWRVAGE